MGVIRENLQTFYLINAQVTLQLRQLGTEGGAATSGERRGRQLRDPASVGSARVQSCLMLHSRPLIPFTKTTVQCELYTTPYL